MKVDYIIVGLGLAGISFCEYLIENNKSFVVLDNQSQQSSIVAGGLYNPVILKRFTPVWKSTEQLNIALPFYKKIEDRLDIKIDFKIPVYRKFVSVEEQNNWFLASEKYNMSNYLSSKIKVNNNEHINANLGFGEVLETGRIDTNRLISAYKSDLLNNNRLLSESFIYKDFVSHEDFVSYYDIKAKHLIFAEGFGIKKNPYFKDLPLVGTKGELLLIRAPELDVNYILKSSVFLIPQGNSLYVVGATYNWKDKSHKVTVEARNELLSKLDKLINCKYEVIDQFAGIRPTVKDRRPIVGNHKHHKNIFVLNGLGTRGVMIAPYVSNQLYNFIENGTPLDTEIDIKRFE